jgi:hypothetical protein
VEQQGGAGSVANVSYMQKVSVFESAKKISPKLWNFASPMPF